MKLSFISAGLNRVNQLILIALASFMLSPEDLGKLVLFYIVSALITAVMPFGLDALIVRLGSSDASNSKKIIKLLTFGTFAIVILWSLLSLFGIEFLDLPFLGLMLFSSLSILSNAVVLNLLATSKFKFQFITLVGGLAVQFALLYECACEPSYLDFATAQMCSMLFMVVLNLKVIGESLSIELGLQDISRFLRLSLPLMAHSIMLWFLSFFDRFILEIYLGSASLGIYHLTVLIAAAPVLFFELNQNTVIRILANKNTNQVNAFFASIYPVSCALFGVLTMTVFALVHLLVQVDFIFHGEFPLVIVGLVFLAGFAKLHFLMGSAILILDHRTKKIMYATLFSGLTIIIFSFLLIPSYGAIGAAISTAISTSIQSFVVAGGLFKRFKMRRRIRLKGVLRLLAISTAYLTVYLFAYNSNAILLLAVSCALATYYIFLYLKALNRHQGPT